MVFGVGSPLPNSCSWVKGRVSTRTAKASRSSGRPASCSRNSWTSIGLRREDVYIANVVKCRPPQNRDPLPDEIEACSPNLVGQIQTIRPRVICTLGRFATRLVAETDAGISSIRGRAKQMHVAGIPVSSYPCSTRRLRSAPPPIALCWKRIFSSCVAFSTRGRKPSVRAGLPHRCDRLSPRPRRSRLRSPFRPRRSLSRSPLHPRRSLPGRPFHPRRLRRRGPRTIPDAIGKDTLADDPGVRSPWRRGPSQ